MVLLLDYPLGLPRLLAQVHLQTTNTTIISNNTINIIALPTP
jgi:hypothetical protein